jgi:hypothetical protein
MTKMLALSYEDRLRVTMICGTKLSLHTIYPLCGWARSGASKCGTKPVGGSSINAGGGGADLTFLGRKGGFRDPVQAGPVQG